MFSVKKIHIALILLIHLVGCGGSSIHDAVATGDIKFVELRLIDGEDVNLGGGSSHDGKTLLAIASANGHKEIAELLIGNGAIVNRSSGSLGWTPLHYAVWGSHNELVKVLISGNADVNIKDVNGATPLHYASFDSSIETVKLLIEKGANINERNIEQWTPLHFAAKRDHMDIVELIIEKGGEINPKDSQGRTPIDYTFCCGGAGTRITDFLREHGANTGEELKSEVK